MTEDTISEIGIDDDGRLYVRPTEKSFDYVWRAAMEVNWDRTQRRLVGAKPREWTYLDWFNQIVEAVADEYGVALRLTPRTAWSNVPDPLRTEIEALSAS